MINCPICGTPVQKHHYKNLEHSKTTFWFTGLPCAGKTTLCDAIVNKLNNYGYNCLRLDGDVVRQGLCKGLGFTPEGRLENLRRVAQVARMMNEHHTPVFSSFITPTKHSRMMIRDIIMNVKIIYVSTPATICEERDVKGMWKKAREGKILGFTGVDSDYEKPEDYDMIIDTSNPLNQCVEGFLREFFPGVADLLLEDGAGI